MQYQHHPAYKLISKIKTTIEGEGWYPHTDILLETAETEVEIQKRDEEILICWSELLKNDS